MGLIPFYPPPFQPSRAHPCPLSPPDLPSQNSLMPPSESPSTEEGRSPTFGRLILISLLLRKQLMGGRRSSSSFVSLWRCRAREELDLTRPPRLLSGSPSLTSLYFLRQCLWIPQTTVMLQSKGSVEFSRSQQEEGILAGRSWTSPRLSTRDSPPP